MPAGSAVGYLRVVPLFGGREHMERQQMIPSSFENNDVRILLAE
jgi:hypothetical protein